MAWAPCQIMPRNFGERSLGDCCLHSGPATEPKRAAFGRAGERAALASRSETMTNLDTRLTTELEPLLKRALAVGVVALVLCFAGVVFDRQQFFHAYLMAYVFWLGVPLGCLGILMIHHLVGGTWGFVIQRCLESAVRTFPVMALLFLPLLLF